ncbi:MAG TPA: glucosyl-3-phosphoglycerate synthase [Solirubrobacteraceae bacterium]|jgi:glucosyl-3-phosphoglycerate synthase|nr:glucosyl-3-phosphoglycerate synthase [Solirubrobacteraceae bacterium]
MSDPPAHSASASRSERANARLFHHSMYPTERIAAARRRRGLSVSVCLPAKECADTVGAIVASLMSLGEAGALDEVVVIDAASRDGTAEIAERAGARVHQEAELMTPCGPVLGKGDAMWRALSVLRGELICFLDADTEEFSPHFLTGLLGPLLCEPGVSFVKGYYRRPFTAGNISLADGGGRVNHLVARPALMLFYPPLGVVRQPLAGEVAARRTLLERLPFTTGYGVEIGMLIDAWRAVGLEGIGQVDLDEHRNRHQPLSALTSMSLAVLGTIAGRLEREGRLAPDAGSAAENGRAASASAPPERPPLGLLGRT